MPWSAVPGLGENDSTRRGLQNPGYHHVVVSIDVAPASFHYHHGAVIQVSHALSGFFAFLDDVNPHLFTRKHHRFQSVGQLIYVKDLDSLELRHSIQVVICGQDGIFDL